jgi:PIN domain nuclease of toxin-antitoxin system
VRCLLDTCTFLWLNLERGRLSLRAREACAGEGNTLLPSAASAWEITAKHRAGQLALPEAPDQYVPSRRALNGIGSLRFREDDAFQLAKLPASHKEPFDRMLISQAITRGLTILTPDPHISQYPISVIW